MSKGIEAWYITVRRLSDRLGWEISHHYTLASTSAETYITRYSAFKLPDEIQRRIAVLDMVATGDAVPGVGCRWQGHGPGNWFYDIDPWCPFDDLLATGLLTRVKEREQWCFV